MSQQEAQVQPRSKGVTRLVGWSQNPGLLLVLAAETFLLMLGVGLVGPIMPLYAQSFGVGAAAVGSLITAFGVARILINVPAGSLAERIGRRPLLVGGPLVTSLAALMMALASQFGQMIIFRFVQGLGSAVQTTAAMIMMADISTSKDRGRSMSFYQGSLLMGTSVGPIVGGLLAEHFGYRMPFFFYSALALCAAVWSFFAIPETRLLGEDRRPAGAPAQSAALRGQSSWRTVGKIFSNTDFLLVSLVTLTVFFTRTGSRSTVLPLLGNNRLGLGPGELGYTFTLIAVVNFLTLNACGSICDLHGRKMVIVPGCIVCGLALLTFTLSQSYLHFMLSATLLGIGTGIAGPAPAAYVTDLSLPGERGLTMGLYRTVGDLGVSIGPVLLGGLSDRFGYDVALWTNGIMFLAMGLAFGLLAHETAGVRRKAEAPATPAA